MSAARHRQPAAGALLCALLLTGCGGSDARQPATPQPRADRTQRTEAGARATLREYAIAFTSADAVKICDLLDPTSAAMRAATTQSCRREAARLKGRLTAASGARYREQFSALKPVVNGSTATIRGRGALSLRYIRGRWYVSLAPLAGSSPAS